MKRYTLKILIVDDSKIGRMSVIKSLKIVKPDAELFQAANGLEAVEIFKEEKPHVVFLDLTMPVMDGYEALKHIMSIDKEAQVIVVSADIQSEAKLRVLVAGAKNMYPKPINDEKMLQIFEQDLLL
ncbi:MAG: response regulator receiver protein [Sulfurimonas sp. RIFOXYD12_FULL_36_11]|nr:MAG: response regulator receiver protein [Sulfurimonas sp. RIFOXYB12_FULL_35_9]OHE08632.1 MAG: response regulator receiver protein [Sulfurimonas sp. RIFOXYC2_FULL_36_7]OHE18928.1 MAG: response regulator receiver protein [Sulfurimonas sp. RIFOXYD2_FULL_37_8]OHE19434.1 MAG: response regulator receiver protein [Sulfurimonas sp. RIFOXYD12_FULL_36_11]